MSLRLRQQPMNAKRYECSLIVPTHNRCDVLAETLSRLEALPDRAYEIIVVDNGSTDDTRLLEQHYPDVRWIRLERNIGAAARNVAAVAARGRVLLMLDDDSWPLEGVVDGLSQAFAEQPDLGAAACRVVLADEPHRHDAGGVPGIFFNCGGAIRREAFQQAGGFPIDFDYYVEEYDLCCRLLQKGWRISQRADLVVRHRRVAANRDNNRMLRYLVRNNLRLWHRYAPQDLLDDMIETTIERYRRVAIKENALVGFERGLTEGSAEIARGLIRRHPLTREQFDALFGLDDAEQRLRDWADNRSVETVAVWGRGKGCEQLLSVMSSVRIRAEAVYDRAAEDETWRGIPLRGEDQLDAEAIDGIIVGTLSPGVGADVALSLRSRFRDVPVFTTSVFSETQPRDAFALA